MVAGIDAEGVRAFLTILGERWGEDGRLTLLGGCALLLLGNSRTTLDIDYVGDDIAKTPFQHLIDKVAAEQRVHVDAVPIDQFVPVPADSEARKIHVGRYGRLDVFVLDPYVIAISKLDRGFDSDLDDVDFLLQRGILDLDRLKVEVTQAMDRANSFQIDPVSVRARLDAVAERRGRAL